MKIDKLKRPNPKDFKITNTSGKNDGITQEYYFKKLLRSCEKFFLAKFLNEGEHCSKFLKAFVTFIYWSIPFGVKMNFTDLRPFKKEFYWFFNFYKKQIDPKYECKSAFDYCVDYLKQKYAKFIDRIDNNKATYKEKIDKKLLILYMQYDNLEYIAIYNQSSTRYTAEMKILDKLGL